MAVATETNSSNKQGSAKDSMVNDRNRNHKRSLEKASADESSSDGRAVSKFWKSFRRASGATVPVTGVKSVFNCTDNSVTPKANNCTDLRERLTREKAALSDAERRVEQLRALVEKTETELMEAASRELGTVVTGATQRSQDNATMEIEEFTSVKDVLVCRDLVVNEIFPFLAPSDLGSVAAVCKAWMSYGRNQQVWKKLALSRWPHTPFTVICDFWAYYRSQITTKVYEERLTYPHYQEQTTGGDEKEEYYILYELPEIMEDTKGGEQQPVSRCVKVDESLALDMDVQYFYEESLCRCEHGCNHKSAFLRLPLDFICSPFPICELSQRFNKVKISILRASDKKVSLIMDPDSKRFECESVATDVPPQHRNPKGVITPSFYQHFKDIPNHIDFENVEYEEYGKVSPLGFRAKAGFLFPGDEIVGGNLRESQAFVSGNPFHSRDINGMQWFTWPDRQDATRVHFASLVLGFDLNDTDADRTHMAPPLEPESLSRFLEMAGVEWY